MKITRRFTAEGQDVFASVKWVKRTSKISNPDGSVVFEMKDAEVPATWSQLATDIMVSKYFRKAGVPQYDASGNVVKDKKGKVVTGPERSAKQTIHRLAGCWRHWGEKHGYFDTAEDAQAFYDELCHMLINQMAAPNSPQWFNTGLNWAYGINGPAQGHWITDPETGETRLSEDSYTHPQPHACFIQGCKDDLVNEGGIMDLWVREARLFKYGSGTGSNFSQLRSEGEPLSGGGKSSGLMSFLKIGDRAAGAIKSGGTTRRAAKMVCLDLDHPDIETFVNWKVREELKVAALVEGLKQLPKEQQETAEKLGLKLDYDFNGEAYQTVAGQNANNSVRIPHAFFEALEDDGFWEMRWRTDPKHVAKKMKARDLWGQIGFAAWRCADPGVQYDGTINDWHTCPAAGRINASNPCSEYMFLDNTACNLASINLLTLYDRETRQFDVEGFEHATRIWTIVLEVSVLMAQFPSKEIARLSYLYRTLGLGFANLGAMLMQAGIPYDSDTGRAIAGAIGAIMTGRSYATSAETAKEMGPFLDYERNRDSMLRVMRNHRRAAYDVPRDGKQAADHALGAYEGLTIPPVPISEAHLTGEAGTDVFGGLSNSPDLLDRARRSWDDALTLGEKHGYRNAQATVIAPTGTIGLLMDCDTTGVEPDFALVKFKKLAGGGYFKIANQSIRPALDALGYDGDQVDAIMTYVMGTGSLDVPMPDDDGQLAGNPTDSFADYLKAKGFTKEDLGKITDGLPGALELSFAINAWALGEEAMDRLGLTGVTDILAALDLTKAQVRKLTDVICGTGTIEGAPHLVAEHYPVFDCANKCGKTGVRFIAPSGHIHMMAAVQPFISGAISKTINLPSEASVEDIQDSYHLSWTLGLKANALYRDGSKLSQVLSSTADADDEVEDEEGIEAAKEEVIEAVVAAADESDVATVEKIVERIVEVPLRRRLPDTRRSLTHKFNVAGHEGYLTVGLYDDGNPGELFITMAKEGSTIGGLMDALGTAISVSLQYGVPVESLVSKFSHARFEPAGMTDNRDIPFAKSLVDYIFRWMGMQFIEGYREANAPQRPGKKIPAKTTATIATPAKPGRITKSDNGGHGNGHGAKTGEVGTNRIKDLVKDPVPVSTDGTQVVGDALSAANSSLMGDAPACDVCGSITVRNGTCYKCLNCGNSMGCS